MEGVAKHRPPWSQGKKWCLLVLTEFSPQLTRNTIMPYLKYSKDASRWRDRFLLHPRSLWFFSYAFPQKPLGDVQPSFHCLTRTSGLPRGSGSNGRNFKLPVMASKGFVVDRLTTRQAKKPFIRNKQVSKVTTFCLRPPHWVMNQIRMI